MSHSPFPWTRRRVGFCELVDANNALVVFTGGFVTAPPTDHPERAGNTALVEALGDIIAAGNAMADFMETCGATGGDYETMAAAWRAAIEKGTRE